MCSERIEYPEINLNRVQVIATDMDGDSYVAWTRPSVCLRCLDRAIALLTANRIAATPGGPVRSLTD